MKLYVIDQLRPSDFQKIQTYLNETFGQAEMEGIYWCPLPDDLLTSVQSGHADCHPLAFALELEPTRLSCEFLIRTRKKVFCECISYANDAQRNWIIQSIDAIFEKLGIVT